MESLEGQDAFVGADVLQCLHEERRPSALLLEVRQTKPIKFCVALPNPTHRDCQKVDYKQGKPPSRTPHKASCGKTHVDPALGEEALKVVDGTLDTGTLRLYTPTPTTALQAQVDFLGRNPEAHYGFARANGKYIPHQIQGQGGVLFLQMRKEALEERNLASIAVMERLLLLSNYPTDVYKGGDYVWQLEREYEVDLDECHRILVESKRHQDLINAWFEWVTPRTRDDDPTKGVTFQMPWYYLLGRKGEFIHPKLLPSIKEIMES